MGIVIRIDDNTEEALKLQPTASYLLTLVSDVTSAETRYKIMSPLERALHNERKAELSDYLAFGYTFPEEVYPFTFEGIIYISPTEQLTETGASNVIQPVQPFDASVLIEEGIPPVRNTPGRDSFLKNRPRRNPIKKYITP